MNPALLSDALFIALVTAIFNAGVTWATVRFLVERVKRLERKVFNEPATD